MTGCKPFYFTFGLDFPLSSFVQRVDAVSEDEARRGMFRFYADKWAFCYHGGSCFESDDGSEVAVGGRTYKRIAKIIVVDECSGEIYSSGGLAA